MTHKRNSWTFFNPVENKDVTMNPLNIEGMLYSMVPEVRNAEFKYGQAVARLLLNYKEIQSNYQSASELNEIIKIITAAHQHEWDSNLRNLSMRELKDFFHNETKTLNCTDRDILSKMTFIPNNSYSIVHVKDFEQAAAYKNYCSWCITTTESMWNSYSAGGINNVYFVLKSGFENMVEDKFEQDKKDEYSLSMISVIVRPFGNLAFCTGRYNHRHGGNDALFNTLELSELIGRNYFEVFKPKSGKELEEVIFSQWTEVEPDSIALNKGWKLLKKVKNNEFWDTTKFTYYDPEMLYLVFDSVGEADTYGIRVVQLEGKYNLINENGDLLL